jgi:CheY-like chemotaxis protein
MSHSIKVQSLIVDDSRLACKVLAKMLDSIKIGHKEAYSAESALALLETFQPDIIFLDHSMSGMSGLDMIAILKVNPKTENIPIIMHTAKENPEYVERAKALGAVDVLPKGVEESRFLNILRKLNLIAKNTTGDEKIEPKIPFSPNNTEVNDETKTIPAYPSEHVSSYLSKEEHLWSKKIEPFLNRSKTQQEKENQYILNLQTRKIIREFHLTLENLEHALVIRMESHADFVASTEQIARESSKKWFVHFGVIILLFQCFIIWLLFNQSPQSPSNTSEVSHHILVEFNQKLDWIQEKIKLLESSNYLIHSNFTKQNENYLTLVGDDGDFVADLFISKDEAKTYKGWTKTGYTVNVNAETNAIGLLIQKRYYLNNDCTGDSFIKGVRGEIYRGENNHLWFIDKQTLSSQLQIQSIFIKKKCMLINKEFEGLYLLKRNNSVETGIDHQTKVNMLN